MKRTVLRVLAALAAGYALLVLAGWLGYRRLLFPAPRDAGPTPPADAVLRELRAADDVTVRALHFPAPPGASTLVHFHGNGETLSNLVLFGAALRRGGLGVLLVEYRGYGSSPGAPTEEGLYLDAEAALDALAADGVSCERIVLCGMSLGTGVAAEMARRGRGGRLILMAPYSSIPRLARRYAPFLPTSLIVGDHFDTLAKARDLRLPTLVVHGDADEVIPYDMGREVAAAISGAELITVPGGHHNDLFARESPDLLAAVVAYARGEALP